VTTVVVSADQDVSSYAGPLRLVPARDVLEAAQHFGLCPTSEQLPLENGIDVRARLERFQYDNERSLSTSEWVALSHQADYVARFFGATNPRSTEALSWAVQFAVHAGDVASLENYFDRMDPSHFEQLPKAVQARCLIHRATALIDSGANAATQFARDGFATVLSLSSTEREELLGRAHGTLGRALMHAGQLTEAVEQLRFAVDAHAAQPEQVPRSLCYLATCLRLAGAPRDARACVLDALKKLESLRSSPNAPATRRYLNLELGRCELVLGSLDAARSAFELVLPDDADTSHPRISALRGLAQVCRRLNLPEAGDQFLRRCLSAAHAATGLLQRVAAAAAGEAVLDKEAGLQVSLPHSELLRCWRLVASSEHDINATLQRLIY
jgi:hypothetical protein